MSNPGPSSNASLNTTPLLVPPGTSYAGNATTVSGVSLDSSGNPAALVSSSGVKIGVGSSYATDRRRREALNFANNGALIACPAWANATAYAQGIVRKLPGGQLIVCSTAGTSGGSAPAYSGQAPITDNTVTWVPWGRVSRVASTREVPTITTASSAPFATTYNIFPASGSGTMANQVPTNISNPINPTLFFGGSGGQQLWPFYNTGTNATLFGITGTIGFQGVASCMEFLSDAPAISIATQSAPASNSGGQFWVWAGELDGQDMYQVEECTTQPGNFGVNYYTITWPAGRRYRRYRVEGGGPSNSPAAEPNFIAVNTDAQSSVVATPIDGLRGLFITDSYANTVSPAAISNTYVFSILCQKYAGIRYAQAVAQSGAGYVSGSTTFGGTSTTVQLPLLFNPINNAFSLSAGFVPDVVIFGAGFNDVNSGSAQIQANVLYCLQQARILWTNALIIVFGPQIGTHNGSAGVLASEAAIKAAWQQWNDPRSAFFPIQGDPAGAWESGTGFYGSATGTGNADFYTGTDGTHPPQGGHEYFANRYAKLIDQAMASFGI